MSDEFYMPGLSHFENDNGWSGRQGPFCRDYAVEDAEAFFALSEEGVAAMTAWLLQEAEEMNAHPKRTPEECRAHYEKLSRGGT